MMARRAGIALGSAAALLRDRASRWMCESARGDTSDQHVGDDERTSARLRASVKLAIAAVVERRLQARGRLLPLSDIYQQSSPSDPIVCSADNPQMRAGAQAAFSRTATAFSPYANIYAPYYRQAAIQVLAMRARSSSR